MRWMSKHLRLLQKAFAALGVLLTSLLALLKVNTLICLCTLVVIAVLPSVVMGILLDRARRAATSALYAGDPVPFCRFNESLTNISVLHTYHYAIGLYETGEEEKAYSILTSLLGMEKPPDISNLIYGFDLVFILKTAEEKRSMLRMISEADFHAHYKEDHKKQECLLTLAEADILLCEGKHAEAIALLSPYLQDAYYSDCFFLLYAKAKLALGEDEEEARELLSLLVSDAPSMHTGREAKRILEEIL